MRFDAVQYQRLNIGFYRLLSSSSAPHMDGLALLNFKTLNIMESNAPLSQPVEGTTSITRALLDKKALAARLGLSTRTVDNLVAARELPKGVRVGRFLYWTEQAVCAWQDHVFAKQRAWAPKGSTRH